MITTPRLFLALFLALSGLGAATAAVADAGADADYAALTALADQPPPWASRGPDGTLKAERKAAPSERILWFDRQGEANANAALKFMTDHPADPRRWNAAAIALGSMRNFVVTVKPGYDEAVAVRDSARMKALVETDAAAQDAWTERMEVLEVSVLAASNASAEAVGEALYHGALRIISNRALSLAEKLAKLRGICASITQRAPESRYFLPLCDTMLWLAEGEDPAAYAGLLQEMKTSPNAAVAALATGRLKAQAARTGMCELAFTALDGRKVDLSKLRGKVVLMDFWATWCGPCMAEMPNVKKIYAAYNEKGFEIVGISCDVAPDRATGSYASAARTGPQVLEFCQKNGMPWPQHFEGRKHNEGGNLIAARFGVTSIPATFLIDQTGQVVAVNLRGEKLEAEVKRLLKL